MRQPLGMIMWLLPVLFFTGCSGTLLTYEVKTVAELRAITGEVIRIAGTFLLRRDEQGHEVLDSKDKIYVVRQDTGLEIEVTVDETTEIELNRQVTTHDRIEAVVSQDGHAMAIKLIHRPGDKKSESQTIHTILDESTRTPI